MNQPAPPGPHNLCKTKKLFSHTAASPPPGKPAVRGMADFTIKPPRCGSKTAPMGSLGKFLAPFDPCLKSRAVRLQFGQTDVLKMTEAVDFLTGRDMAQDAVGR